MRKYIGMFLTILVISFVYSVNIFAAETSIAAGLPIADEDLLESSGDFQAIQLLESEIRSNILALGAKGVPEHIDFSKAVRVYVDTNLVALGTIYQEAFLEELNDSNYIWVVPVEAEGEWCSVTIARGLPFDGDDRGVLTDEDMEYLRNMEGKWHITETIRGGAEGYYSRLLNYGDELPDYDRIIIVSSQPGIRMPIAIGFSEGEACSWISLGYAYPVISDSGNARGIDNGIYDFETIAELARDYSGGYGAGGYRSILLYAAIFLGCAATAGLYIKFGGSMEIGEKFIEVIRKK